LRYRELGMFMLCTICRAVLAPAWAGMAAFRSGSLIEAETGA